MRQLSLEMRQLGLKMSLELSMNDPMKNYAKSIRSLQKNQRKTPTYQFLEILITGILPFGSMWATVQIPSMYTSLANDNQALQRTIVI